MNNSTCLAEGEKGVHLDGPVEPAEEDGYRQQEDVDRKANEMSDQFDELREDHPAKQEHHGKEAFFSSPIEGCSVNEIPQGQVTDKGWRRQSGQLNGVRAPGLRLPDLSFGK